MLRKVLEFFNKHAEVRCVRMAGTEVDRAAYVEFTHQTSIIKAFGLMGTTLNGRQIMVQHSSCAIIKPANNMGLIEDTTRLALNDSKVDHRRHDRYRSRSRSRDRRSRSRRRSTSRRRRTRSRERRRSRSRHGKRRSRTRSRSRGRRRHSRSVSRERRRTNRGPSRSRDRKKYRSRSRSDKRRSSRSRSRGRRGDRREREKDRGSGRSGRDRNRERERRDKDFEKERHREKDKDRRRDSRSDRKHGESPKTTMANCEEKSETTLNTDHPPSPPHSQHENESISNRAITPQSDASGINHEQTVANQSSDLHNGQCETTNSPNAPENSNNRPVVLGVKLAGPEDMDPPFSDNAHSEPKLSPTSLNGDSSDDAMDTEA